MQTLSKNLGQVMFGKDDTLTLCLVALLGKGHLLIEDVPGVGKTSLARGLAQSVSGEFKRLQCTPDLLPSDITGVSIFDQRSHSFEFIPGPVFANILLADEINRAPPRAQSALLECMGEQQVTVDGHTHRLPGVFMVIATQNPLEFQGTYALPEAQLDRFFMRIKIGYPDTEAELKMIAAHRHGHPLDKLAQVISLEQVAELQRAVEEIRVGEDVARYALEIVRATRVHPGLLLGASPRASLATLRAAQALSVLRGENFITPAHVKYVAPHVLAHRIIPRTGGNSAHAAEAIVSEVLGSVPVPV
ncbi:MoxR family ATPase [soil metagenome]